MSDSHTYAGLTQEQVLRSRAEHGANVMTPPKPKPLWKAYLEKYQDPMILILLIALVFSFGLSSYDYFSGRSGATVFLDPLGILVAVLLATSISFIFERRAEREFRVLNQVNDSTLYKVIREGHIHQVEKSEIVVGDVVLLDTGEEVPADGVLLESLLLQVNESSLTGEPMANKNADPAHNDPEATYPSNRLYRGSVLIGGNGVFEVTAVGDATEAGAVFKGIQTEEQEPTPLSIQLEGLARVISYAGYILAGLVVIVRLWYYFRTNDLVSIEWLDFGGYMLNTLMLAVTLLVVAVPEGLPMSISLSLAYSMRSMLKTNNLVRRMHACETLGATTVICTDKTGTLTQNQMRVAEVIIPGDASGSSSGGAEITSARLGLLTRQIVANTTAHLEVKDGAAGAPERVEVLGNPTEGALLLWLRDHGVDYWPARQGCDLTYQLPFSTERKYMASELAGENGEREFLLKGAPEYIFDFCDSALTPSGERVPVAQIREGLMERLQGFQAQGMRTLALAHRVTSSADETFVDENRVVNSGYTLLAIFAIQDPVRGDVLAAIDECLAAGVRVKIVTGDTFLTTREIARQIGLWDKLCSEANNAMSGAEFMELSDEEACERLKTTVIIYRARPMDKARMIQLLQSMDEVVAVTGDGTNDAPALRAAHVGLSMGDGTAVAKSASDMTILDNSFVSIGKGIMWGRSLYQNIQRFIIFQLTINVAACLIVLVGSLFGGHSPLTITQMLWINLIMDTFAALALASLPPNPHVMKDKPRAKGDFIISRSMAGLILGGGLVMVFFLFLILEFFEHAPIVDGLFAGSWIEGGAPLNVKGPITPYEGSLFFSFFVFIQLWNLFNAKAFRTGRSAFYKIGDPGNHRFLLVLGFIVLGQLLMMNFGGRMFDLVPLIWQDQLAIVLISSLVLIFGELSRLVTARIMNRR